MHSAQCSARPVTMHPQDSALCAMQSAQHEKLKRENTRLQAEVERLEKEVLRQKALRCAHWMSQGRKIDAHIHRG